MIDVEKVQSRLDALKSLRSQKSGELAALKKNYEAVVAKITEMGTTPQDLPNDIKTLEDEITTLEAAIVPVLDKIETALGSAPGASSGDL